MTETEKQRLIRRIREELTGRYFSSKSEIRHMAEGAGFSFVPVEFVSMQDHHALVSLRPKGLGEIRVRAARPVPWEPYYITDVVPG